MNFSPHICLWFLKGWNTSSLSLLLCPVSLQSPPACSTTTSSSTSLVPSRRPQACTRAADKDTNTTSGSSPHDRDESLSGWKEEFKKTDKYSFIATYLKELIIYGYWCGIFYVGCLWTNSVVLCKLAIWPSLCIFLTLAALHSHVLWA